MKKHTSLVSVIIPVFNGAMYLAETVSSIQKSTFKNFEIILVDDGSTDTSKLICERLAEKYKNLSFYSFSKNRGMDRVLNFALKKAKGQYICRINQDDRMLPHRMKKQVKFLVIHKDVVAVGSHIKLFDKNNRSQIVRFLEKDAEIKKFWLILSPFSDPSVMYRKQTALSVGGYQQSFWPADDVHMWYKMGKIGKLANIQQALVEVRWHQNAGSLKYFRRNTIVTCKLHLWADKNIQKAGMLVQLFWLFQLLCGLTLPPEFNWGVYRVLKRGINKIMEVQKIGVKTAKQVKKLNTSPFARPQGLAYS